MPNIATQLEEQADSLTCIADLLTLILEDIHIHFQASYVGAAIHEQAHLLLSCLYLVHEEIERCAQQQRQISLQL